MTDTTSSPETTETTEATTLEATPETPETQTASATETDPTPDSPAEHPAHPMHKVLSFVRRSGRLDARLQRAWDNYAGDYLLDIAPAAGSLDVREGFTLDHDYVRHAWGNDNPLIIEIGTGQGENVVAAAESRPNENFLALEVYDPGVAHTLLLAGKRGLKNIRVAQANAPELFKACADGVAAEVWTFFPDPWPKMKHHKRRIVQPELAGEIRRTLADGGIWRIATDIEDYALHVHEVMDDLDGWRNEGGITVSLPTGHVGKGNAELAADMPHADFTESTRFEGRVLTNFEKKGLAAGRVIHDFTYRKA
ncbi:tRNA (guanosine(46)-N7)-methyltransferase TrmB [Bifidobacterium callitrichos]|uniref:tRNA (guanine-N(7)-)-methyltransferase n=1 Tax=Bifidobacterium callitrichos DSM 23973 TaxID=1437609 RepID=A0A087ABK9_9BIFI|nr:tRNA (guanosine(46)-N7)-methyltransferase TrmB [Bifidobacterium callitrichos]KFI56159.1 tRNA (guanine-N(7)-)-methyltransferase [Bifidobacterium callitrichos DSM 23973]